jgi:hypothetical protein
VLGDRLRCRPAVVIPRGVGVGRHQNPEIPAQRGPYRRIHAELGRIAGDHERCHAPGAQRGLEHRAMERVAGSLADDLVLRPSDQVRVQLPAGGAGQHPRFVRIAVMLDEDDGRTCGAGPGGEAVDAFHHRRGVMRWRHPAKQPGLHINHQHGGLAGLRWCHAHG